MGDSQQEDARKRQKIQEQLDEALAASFPASDPVSIVTSNEEEDWGTEPTVPEPAVGKPAAGKPGEGETDPPRREA
jgi:hypothetical protein